MDVKKQVLQALETEFDRQQKDAVEFNKLQAVEQQLTQKADSAKRAVETINRAIIEIEQSQRSK